jgi:membrane protease YdiL (CAAX protease family)
MFRKPVFWIAFVIVFIATIIFTYNFFSKAFPLITLDLQMDRVAALQKAQELAQKYHWGPENFRQASSFQLDNRVQNYVELEVGGSQAFKKMMEKGLYEPYTWQIRDYREGETNETLIRFTPAGKFYGFKEKLPEDEPGANLPPDSAQKIAEVVAAQDWGIDFSQFKRVEASKQVRPGGRTDHTFVYERPNVQIGEGKYRLRLVVSGDKLTELTHFIKIPEAFYRKYEEMRSANNTLAMGALIAAAILFVIGGCIVGVFFLFRQGWVLWKRPLFWGIFIALLHVLSGINQLPLAWMNYDTALSATGFLLEQLVQLLGGFIFLSVLLTLSFIGAETLSRKAFPHHIQQWKLWSTDVASSPAVLGRTAAGYMLVGLFFAYDVAAYFFFTRVLGWWLPSEALFEPDVLASYFPWLSSIAVSAQAGFWEESLFRAVPIAGAALLGQRFGKRKLWIAAAFVIQALVFGGGHANYANQPAYARIVELIIPATAFGLIYIRFGLYPAIILHYAIDVAYIAMPLFVAKTPGIWIQQVIVILLLFVPLWIAIIARIRARRWSQLKDEDYNRGWTPPPVTAPQPAEVEESKPREFGKTTRRLVIIGGVSGLVIWLLFANFENNAPQLTVDRNEAKKLAKQALVEKGIQLQAPWWELSSVETPLDQDDRFIWQTGSEADYGKLMGHYIDPPQWKIRFVKFEGDVAERAEEYQVYIAGKGKILRISHILPEARPGDSLAESAARAIADSVIQAQYNLNPENLKRVSAAPSKLPNRTDWEFTYADTVNYSLKEGEARIAVDISGDEVTDSYQYIHVPEGWARQERNERNLNQVFQGLSGLLIFLMLITGAIGGIVRWSKKSFPGKLFLHFFVLLIGVHIILIINKWPATMAGFSTAEPLSNQALMAIILPFVAYLFLSGGLALIAGLVQTWKREQVGMRTSPAILVGISVGAILAGLGALLNQFAPNLSPIWADYQAVQTYLPIGRSVFSPLVHFILVTTIFSLIFVVTDRVSIAWTQKKIFAAVLLLLLGLITSATESILSIPFWLLSGLVMGIVYILIYLFIFRCQLALIPIAFAVIVMLGELKQGVMNAFPTALPGAILAMIIVGAFSFYWYRKLAEEDAA